jgi:chemotaxis protein methyltransferase CheR
MIQINDREFSLLTGYMQENFGINLTKKRTLIESRLNNYLVNKGYDNYEDYLSFALGDNSGKEVSQILNFLTTNYSYFMREWDQFQYFRDIVLPEIEPKIRDNDLRVWSAGCSSGQEPYTLSMITMDYLNERQLTWDAKVLATDISIKALEAAKNGLYDEDSIKNIPAKWRTAYFHKTADQKYQVNDKLKSEVIFRRFNLIEDEFPFKKKMNVIFCRNVMIYFNEQTKKDLVARFYDSTANGGYLFIGQSEFIDKSETKYVFVKPSIYKKTE